MSYEGMSIKVIFGGVTVEVNRIPVVKIPKSSFNTYDHDEMYPAKELESLIVETIKASLSRGERSERRCVYCNRP